MKKIVLACTVLICGIIIFAGTSKFSKNSNGFVKGNPEIKSISSLTFGPKGVLFIGDSKSASVFAINTKDSKAMKAAAAVEIKNIDQVIAASLGTQKDKITITDMAVNPISKKVYVSVQNSDGTPVLLCLEGSNVKAVSLKDVEFSSIALNNVVAEDAKDQRGRPLRISTISDMGYLDGKLLLSGLSNKEFSSSFRSISFPFSDKQDQSSLEIYHAAHGRYETAAPIKTFTTTEIAGEKYLVASYTCTPLVLFPFSQLKSGMHVRGRTVAEMGSGNTPVDMISVQNNGESFLVMANTNKPVAKVNYKSIVAFQGTLTEKVSGTAGASFVALPFTNVLQMDKLDDNQVVMIQRKTTGEVDLLTTNAKNL
jgi:hypothetical protein